MPLKVFLLFFEPFPCIDHIDDHVDCADLHPSHADHKIHRADLHLIFAADHIDHDHYHTEHHVDLIDRNIDCDMSRRQDAREPCSGPACRGA